MNYDAFETTYGQSQIDRITKSLVSMRQRYVTEGRSAPEEDAVLIGAGRRLQLAVLFLDICHFSARYLESESEQSIILKALNVFFTEMVRIAGDYGGTVEKNTGDGLMAYFEDGGGVPPEMACKRAIACSLTMFRTNSQLLGQLLESSGIRHFEFRVGIDYGNVTIARIGAPRRFNTVVAIGTTANIASKMLRFAGPNELVIGDSVKWQLPTSWRQYVTQLTNPSGWIYRLNGAPYAFHKYNGRWKY